MALEFKLCLEFKSISITVLVEIQKKTMFKSIREFIGCILTTRFSVPNLVYLTNEVLYSICTGQMVYTMWNSPCVVRKQS